MSVTLEEARQMPAGTVVVILPDGSERYLSASPFAVREEVSDAIQVEEAAGVDEDKQAEVV